MATTGDQGVIRQALMRELETINAYQALHDQAEDAVVRQLLLHLMNEEKEHVAELTVQLRQYDAEQDAHFREGHAAALADRPLPEKARTDLAAGTGWTVGSLLDRSG